MKKLSTLLIILILFVSKVSFSSIEVYSERLEDSDITGAVFELYDDKYFDMLADPTGWSSEFTNYRVKNFVQLGINPEVIQTTTYTSGTLDVTIDYQTWDDMTNSFVWATSLNRTLTVSYDYSTGTTLIDDLSTVAFEGAHRIKVTVGTISGLSVSNLFLESRIEVERYYSFNATAVTNIVYDTTGTNYDYIEFKWDFKRGAEFYELEWVHINDYKVDTNNYFTSAQLKYDYYLNSTRVETKDNFYRIPKIFDHGYLIFRVRAVGRQGNDFEYRKDGAWSANESGVVSDHPSSQTYFIYSAYDKDMNWAHQVGYTEDGKRMEALSFSDGLGRGRQSVAHNTETQQAVVSNVYYDEMGRPVISDLPTPVDGEQLKHYPDFNRADTTGKPSFQVNYFDIPGDSCLAPMAMPFSDTLGTGKYYSTNNGDKDGENAYIPDAGGFPYTRITYKNDFSGRIDRVSGAGDTLKMGSGRETQYFYPSPNQYELNDLFGSEIGKFEHYTKMLTIDPNGQIYVQYTDMAGRVVVSYMAGPSPDNLTALDNNVGDSVQIDLISGGQSPDLGTTIPSTTFTHTEFITEDGETYTFNYSFTPEEYTSACLSGSICFDCVYDLNISVKDACGVFYWDSTAQINGATFDATCSSTGQQSYEEALVLPQGEYTISKKLTVNQDAIDEYWCFYIDNDTCTTTITNFFNDLYENEPFISCDAASVYEDDTTSGCDVYRNLMLLDLNPGGQYAEYYDSSGVYTSSDPTSIFYTDEWENATYFDENGDTIYVVNSAGNTVTPDQLSSNEFIDLFEPIWAEALLDQHPEYCYLQFCENNSASHDYNDDMVYTYEFDTACANGYFLPLGNGPSPSISIFSSCSSSNTDPFFDDGGWAYATLMDDTMSNYLTIQSTTYNMWQAAMIAVSCPEVTTSTAADACLSNWDSSDTCFNDLLWVTFRDMYLENKMTYYVLAQQDYADSIGCSNECIGSSATGCEDYADKISRFGNIETLFGSDIYATPDSIGSIVSNTTATSCTALCEGYVDDWLIELAGCDFASVLDSTETANMRQDMIELCAWGCDSIHPIGATTTAGGAADTTSNGYASVDDILTDYLGSSYENELCTELLITSPGPYIDSANMLASVMGKLDTCACVLIYEAEIDLAADTVLGFTTVEEMLAYNTGVSMNDIDYLMCACDHVLGEDQYGPIQWDPTFVWGSWGAGVLASYDYDIPAELSCHDDCVIDCSVISAESDTLDNRFSGVTDFHNQPTYELILTNYMNGKYNYHLPLGYYLDFLNGCEASGSAPYCQVTDEATELLDILKLLAFRGQFTNTSSDIVDLQSENIVYENSEMINLFDDHDYWSSQSDSTLTIYLDSGDCNISFTSWDNFDFNSIVNFTYIAPLTDTCPNINQTFEIGIEYIDCGALVPGILNGSSTCFEINDCVCGDEGQTLCDEPYNIEQDPCYEPELSEMYINAMNSWNAAVEDAYDTFAANYNDTCSQSFNTEALSYSGKIRNYQYTLFYYDQAGNLVKTIAPKGKDESFSSSQTSINSARASVISSTSYGAADIPGHDYATVYKYNSYNQLVETTNPDQDGNTQFWYDFYGRIIASQNPVQQGEDKYSYTFYDVVGRPVEVGQVEPQSSISESITEVDDLDSTFEAWVRAGVRTEVTITTYDDTLSTAISNKFKSGSQQNLVLRVATVAYFNEVDDVSTDLKTDYESATHYSYDLHGNVVETIQDVPMMAPVNLDAISTQYEFELISGNVKTVTYQEDELDYMRHDYDYDKLNRLTEVFTSTDTIYSTQEAHYRYYDYGPLARTEIGKNKVQGLDYAYTINGWLKSMNASTLNKFRDIGKDGNQGSSLPYYSTNIEAHKLVAKDVVGYTIGYFNGDYNAIGTSNMEADYSGSGAYDFGNGSNNLYNGNIRHLVTSIEGLTMMGTAYSYDQLQRLKTMTAYYNTNSTNDWNGVQDTTDYYNSYTYDENGNFKNLKRNAYETLGLSMDNFTYHYVGLDGNPLSTSSSRSNRLNYVTDAAANDGVADDITSGQTTDNYTYDEIGELISDVDEGIDTIYWRRGDKKIKKIIRDDANSSQVEFYYNPFGQRVIKLVKPRTSGVLSDTADWIYTYYGYDANGQVMAIYEAHIEDGPTAADATLEEFNIYGSSRIGQIQLGKTVWYNGAPNYGATTVWQNTLGERAYEITNHLGNVNAVINDRKLWNSTDTLYEAVVIMSADYYPYGMVLPGRSSNADSYKYGYNGMESDDEIKGVKNSYTTEFRQYDPRLGRWLSLDPEMKKLPWQSPYASMDNNPIYLADPKGDDGIITIKGNTITISARIYVYGNAATQAAADRVQKQIMDVWNAKDWTYTDENGKVYNVKFEAKVHLYYGKEKMDPFIIPGAWDPTSRNNYIGLTWDEDHRSYVRGGDEGLWNYRDIKKRNTAAHEFGHLIGFDDRYSDNDEGYSEPHEGWETNIMANSTTGVVEQRNIDAIVKPTVDNFNQNKANDEYNTQLLNQMKENANSGKGQGIYMGSASILKWVSSAYKEYKSTGKYKEEINISVPKF